MCISIPISLRKYKYAISVSTHANTVSFSQKTQICSHQKTLNESLPEKNPKTVQCKYRSFSDISQDNDACVVMKSYSTFVVWLTLNCVGGLIWNVLFIYMSGDIREQDLKKICINM